MRAKVAVIVTGVAAAYVVAAAQQNPFVGRWNLTGTGSDNHLIYFLEVKQVGDHLEVFELRIGVIPDVHGGQLPCLRLRRFARSSLRERTP